MFSYTQIVIEYQPFKNPRMVMIQNFLYASIRTKLHCNSITHVVSVSFVHAKTKAKGETQYERKKNAIKRVNEFLTSTLDFKDPGFIQSNKFNETTKKDDLADCLCMCLDNKYK